MGLLENSWVFCWGFAPDPRISEGMARTVNGGANCPQRPAERGFPQGGDMRPAFAPQRRPGCGSASTMSKEFRPKIKTTQKASKWPKTRRKVATTAKNHPQILRRSQRRLSHRVAAANFEVAVLPLGLNQIETPTTLFRSVCALSPLQKPLDFGARLNAQQKPLSIQPRYSIARKGY